MKESDFLIKTLNEWCSQFEGIHIRYAYDANSEYHIVEVDPESVRRGNDMYKKAELSLWIAFTEKFPEADLLICEPSNANDMTNCMFQSNSGEMMLERWESFWSENLLFSSNVTHLSKRSAYFKSNEYDNLNEYTLAA